MMLRATCLALSIVTGISVTDGSAQEITWGVPQSVAASNFDNQHPRIVLQGNGSPIVLWGSQNASAAYLSRWSGLGFTTPIKLNSMGISLFASSWAGPELASKGDTVYAIFKAKPEDTAGIYIVRSFNGGASFSMPIRVDNIPGFSCRFPTISTDAAGQPVVGYMKFNTGFSTARWVVTRSADFGASFSTEVLASSYNGEPVCDCCPGTVVVNSSIAMLYRNNWSDKRTSWAGISKDGGATFPSGMEVDNTNWTINSCPASGPDGVIIGDDLYTTFMSGAGGTRVYYSKSSISSKVSNKEIPLTGGTAAGIYGQNFPRIANDGKSVIIVWPQHVNGNPTISFLFAADIDKGFHPWDTVIENAVGNYIENADVVIKNGNVHVVWEDVASGTVMYRKGTFANSTSITPVASENTCVLSPVPSDAFLQVSIFGGKSMDQCRLSVTDLSGRLVYSREYATLSGPVQIPTQALPNGVYLVHINSPEKTFTGKFVVTHQ